MTTKESLLAYITTMTSQNRMQKPIFRIFLFEHADKELIYHRDGQPDKRSGFPDTGATADMGFYYDIDDAIRAMNENVCDIRETVYDAGFILVQFPGLYQCADTSQRMYFRWDDARQGYFQQEEPIIFRHIAY